MKQNQITEEHWMPARYIKDDKTILDFTGLYEVSDLGRVRSLNYRHTGKAKELNKTTCKCTDQSILYHVSLYKGNKRYVLPVHRLVLSTFKESEFFEGAICDHIEARSETCCDNINNLHWVTYQQNNSTEHCKELLSKAHMNHPVLSKRVRVTDLATGETTVYPSAMEAGRALGINPKLPATRISQHKGFYKKMNLHFMYIE